MKLKNQVRIFKIIIFVDMKENKLTNLEQKMYLDLIFHKLQNYKPNIAQLEMLLYLFILNCLAAISSCRRRYRGGGKAGAGMGKVTETFGKGVASLIKDIKEGTWGEQQNQQYDERTGNRFFDDKKHYDSIGDDTTFTILVVVGTIIIVIAIMYFIVKVLPEWQEKDVREQMKKRNAQRFRHYQAIKCIAENGIHPDKAFGKLQKIKYK